MTSKRITIDLLSSSSDDEKPVAERHALEDTSDEDGGFQSLPTKRNICSSIENISSSLRKIKIGKSHSPTKGVCTTKLDMSQVGLSSDDDDSIIERYGRLKSRKKITTEDFGEHASSGRLKTVVKNTGTDQAGRSRPGAGKAQGRWRLSISRGEYTVSDVSNPNLPNFRIPSTLFDRLYNHQKEGVAWMIGLHAEGVGGLLG